MEGQPACWLCACSTPFQGATGSADCGVEEKSFNFNRNFRFNWGSYLKTFSLAIGNIEELHHSLTRPFCERGATTYLTQTRQRCGEHLLACRILHRLVGSVRIVVRILLRLGAFVGHGSLLLLLSLVLVVILIVPIPLGRGAANQRKCQEGHQKQQQDAAQICHAVRIV